MRWDGLDAAALARALGAPQVLLHGTVASTMDLAHAAAADGAPAGTVVLAESQHAGRGRDGKRWVAAPGDAVLATVLVRPPDAAAVAVLSLRAGLALAAALEPLAGRPVRIKWPNDLLVDDAKVAGILVEARWREGRPDWVAVGVGLNVRPPLDVERAAGLAPGVSRVEALRAVAAAMREAAARGGVLTDDELGAYAARDAAWGRACLAPAVGVVAGLAPDGALLVQGADGVVTCRAGSLIFAQEA